MGDVWFQIDSAGNKVFDLATALASHLASNTRGKIQLSQDNEQARLTVILDDVLNLGQTDLMGQSALMIDGGASQIIDLSTTQWSRRLPQT